MKPKYITFDCYGTLTHFRIGDLTRTLFAGRLEDARMDAFIADFSSFRRDEVLGDWKPYVDVIKNGLERTCRLWRIGFDEADGQRLYDAVPTWGPHADVPGPLARVAREIPLVILSNASNNQIHHNVDKLGAPFHAVYTAEQAGAYKPRLKAFEFMIDQLGCDPADLLHVSAHVRYDLMSAWDLRIPHRLFVNRGYEPAVPFYGNHEIADLAGLPGLLGL